MAQLAAGQGSAQITDSTVYQVVQSASLTVASGGRLVAHNSTFSNAKVTFAAGSNYQPGDLTNNAVDSALQVPASVVPLLSAPLGADNRRFTEISISGSNLTSGMLNLLEIGTETNEDLRYRFVSPFTVDPGATLNVGAGIEVSTTGDPGLTINGEANFAAGSKLTLGPPLFGSTASMNVNGVLRAVNAEIASFVAGSKSLQVRAGGRLVLADSLISGLSVNYADNALLSPTDLSNNRFDGPIVPLALTLSDSGLKLSK